MARRDKLDFVALKYVVLILKWAVGTTQATDE